MKTCSLQRSVASLASAAALGVLLASPPAQAQAQDQAAARALFDDGRRLLSEGKYQEACKTLEAASKLYASPGILLNLGDCYEKVGRTASAWTEFGEAAAVAARARRSDQVAEAKRRQASVEPKLTKLTIHVSGQITGLTITRDDTEIASAAWGEPIPVDPGPHQIKAEATAHQPWTTSIVVSSEGQTVTVEVPTLTPAPTPPPVPVAQESETNTNGPANAVAEAPPARPRPQVVNWVLIGGGTALAVAGGVLWGLGSSKSYTASNTDTSQPGAINKANDDYNSAKTLYFVGIAGVAVGVVAATAGVLLMTVGHHGEKRAPIASIQATPWVATNGAGVQVAGGW
jgi:tetratricopeptide (TPR) repeat protein